MEAAHFILFVTDQDRSRRFYSKVLNREPRLDVPGMTEFDLDGGAVLGLMPEDGARRLLGETIVSSDEPGSGGKAELYLLGDDPESALGRAEAAGAEIVSPVRRRDWGHSAGYCRDPDGHLVAFARNEEGSGWVDLERTITTDRLILRPFSPADAPEITRLAGDRAIAATTAAIPHPYEESMAVEWIGTHTSDARERKAVHWAITLRDGGDLAGAVSLMNWDHEAESAELGYWIAKERWGGGLCSEAAGAVVDFGFDRLGLNRVHAHHFANNPASGKVMLKIGMKHEGRLRQHVAKWGEVYDAELFGILRIDREAGD